MVLHRCWLKRDQILIYFSSQIRFFSPFLIWSLRCNFISFAAFVFFPFILLGLLFYGGLKLTVLWMPNCSTRFFHSFSSLNSILVAVELRGLAWLTELGVCARATECSINAHFIHLLFVISFWCRLHRINLFNWEQINDLVGQSDDDDIAASGRSWRKLRQTRRQ